MATSAEALARYSPPAFRQFAEAVVNLKFDEEPQYAAYSQLFEPLCGAGPSRPIILENQPKVGQKRSRDAIADEDALEARLLQCCQNAFSDPAPPSGEAALSCTVTVLASWKAGHLS